MQRSSLRFPVSIKPEFCIVLALTVLILPIKWIFAWIIASAFHELCHYGAIKLSGCKVFRMQIDINSAVMDTDLLSCSRELLCALAGPLGGVSLLLIAKWCPRVAICGCFQSFYNLIPIFPLDGGRAVMCLLKKFCTEQRAEQASSILDNIILSLFLCFGIYAAIFLKLGILPLLFAVILLAKNKIVKSSCKQGSLRVK